MRSSLFETEARRRIIERLASLREDSRRRWGTMTVSAALCHLSDQLRFAAGERTPRGPGGALTLGAIQWFGIVVMPWPHGRIPTSPELLQTRPSSSFESDRAELLRLIEKVAATDGAGLGPHPMFGALSPRLWGILAYRHLDHHLRQFGA